MLVLCMVAIFMFSSQNGEESSKVSGELTEKIITAVNPEFDGLSPTAQKTYRENMHFIIRKTAHFTIFMLLGISALLTFDSFSIRRMSLKMLLALLICLAYAASDELHQLSSPGRAGQLRDVLIDSSGSVVGILLTALVLCAMRSLRNSQSEEGN